MNYIRFSDLEGLRIAVEMERRGCEFYRHAVRVAKNPKTIELLTKLAADEEEHEKEFALMLDALPQRQIESDYYDEESSAYLSAIAAEIVFQDGLMGMVKNKAYESPQAILEYSIQSEKDSTLFYSEMIMLAKNPSAAAVFRAIVRQEKSHLSKLQQMLMELGRVKE